MDSIRKLSGISRGKTSARYFGVEWRLEFKHDESSFVWTGQYEPAEEDAGIFSSLDHPFADEEDANVPSLLFERLQVDGVVVADRQGEKIILDGKETPKLSNCSASVGTGVSNLIS